MQMSFRWYGPNDPISLADIRQIPGVTGIVSALHEVPVGEVWTPEALSERAGQIQEAGLTWSVVESIPVHEDIKLGRPSRDALIDRYCRSIEHVGAQGIGVVCYNFMPVFDWMRTDLAYELPDGSSALAYDHGALADIDLSGGTGEMPAWVSYGADELAALREAYQAVDESQLWDHLGYFLERVVPAAEAAGVRLAIHPDDPPWPIFGLPRIITSGTALERVTRLVDSAANGVTLCTGSLGADPTCDLPTIARQIGPRVYFAHLRNVVVTGEKQFHESPHPQGRVDLAAVARALYRSGFDGPIRPDHGRAIWGETGRPGYGLYDRALGATYLLGVWNTLVQEDRSVPTST